MVEPSATTPVEAAASRQDVLLATKLRAPRPQPGFVTRHRLLDRLEEGLARGLVVVCAPAGFGKTSLLADWARRSRRPVAWVSLDQGEVLLVLDDYHLIDAQPVHASLGFLLEHRPPGLQLVLASRADPPLALARLRVRGQLAELRAADLRFTQEETAVLLRETVGPNLADAAVAALAARTDGRWPTCSWLPCRSGNRQTSPGSWRRSLAATATCWTF